MVYEGLCPVAVSAEAQVRLFLRRDDEDQQLLGKFAFPCLFLMFNYIIFNYI